MSDFLMQKAISTYFLMDALLSEGIDRKAIMKRITRIFCIKKQSFKLYENCNEGIVREIKNTSAYNRYRRLVEYSKLRNDSDEIDTFDAITEELISIKGRVLSELDKLKLFAVDEGNGLETMLDLAQKANKGILSAMYAYGIILCEGFGVEPNIEEGIKYLKKVADWNNIEACIICIYHCRELKNEFGDKLYTYLLGTPYVKDMDVLSVQYGLSPKKDEIAALTCKLFANHVAAQDMYNWQIARILKCNVLSKSDKQDVLLSGGKDTIMKVNALPLNLESWDGYCLKECASLLDVGGEGNAIESALRNFDTLTNEKYRPVCICSDDLYMLKMFSEKLEHIFEDCNVFRIVIPDSAFDIFIKQFNTEVLRGIKENERNVVIITASGGDGAAIRDHIALQTVKNILTTERRSMFKAECNISLNLNFIQLLPVVLCDRQNLNLFRTTCHVIKLQDMTDAERKKAIEEAIELNAKIYELKSVKTEPDAMDALVKMKCDTAIAILDKLFASYDDGGEAVITLGDVNKFADEIADASRVGF